MCPGPLDCPSAETASCSTCAFEWHCDDTNIPGTCSQCGNKRSTIKRCGECPSLRLQQIQAESFAGTLLHRVLGDFEFAVEKFGMSLDDVTAEEFKAFQIVHEERNKFRDEERQKEDLARGR